MTTKNQILANRLNGLKGGVKTPEGKAVSRLNARKHGIFASALTPEDAKELHGTNDQLAAEIQPVGPVEASRVYQPLWRIVNCQYWSQSPPNSS